MVALVDIIRMNVIITGVRESGLAVVVVVLVKNARILRRNRIKGQPPPPTREGEEEGCFCPLTDLFVPSTTIITATDRVSGVMEAEGK